jgi:hypothetical protein
MNWRKNESQMVQELNERVFKKDRLIQSTGNFNPYDTYNQVYVIELKNRENYSPFAFNGSLIEEIKYRPLMERAKQYNRIPGYIVKFNDGSYYAWNLKQLKRELVWYEKDLPHTTHFTSNNFKLKRVADLYLDEATKLI